ncbi:hypothetical protein B0H11DRAFT_1911427 [Mycena galericulata]|nr:hypothetical protein B0H11DRAFT_1911427 [Mycena galericulata]
MYRGMLYAAGASCPSFVDVPVRLGALDPTIPDSLDITWWIPAGKQPNASSIDLDATRATVTHWPFDAALPLNSAYTICIAPQPSAAAFDLIKPDTHAINDQILKLLPDLMYPIRGNVLVLKHSGGSELGGMEDVGKDDEVFIRSLVKRASRVQRREVIAKLFAIADGESGGVVGSIAQELLTFCAAYEGPLLGEMNLIISRTAIRSCVRLLQEDLGLFHVYTEQIRRPEYEGILSSVHTFYGHGRCITVSCTMSTSVLPALLASRATSQMNILTRTHIISLFGKLTIRGKGMFAWPCAAVGAMFFTDLPGRRSPPLPMDTVLWRSSHFLTTPCGSLCPRIWRQTMGLKGVGVYSWVSGQDTVPFERDRTLPPEIEETFIADLEFGDLLHYSHVARQARTTVQSKLSFRVTSLLLPYFAHAEMSGFWEVLDKGEGGLTGSSVAWVTQTNPSWKPTDLNAVCIVGQAQHTRSYLAHGGWSEEQIETRIPLVLPAGGLTHSIRAHPASSPLAGNTWKFSKTGHPCITLTETAENSVFVHIAGAKHTMATMLLTPKSIIALHPYECLSKYFTFRHGTGLPAHERSWATERAHAMGGRDTFFRDLTDAGRPCGRICPALLRRLRGGTSIGLLRWDAGPEDSVTKSAYTGFMDNRYSQGWTWASCRNSRCDTFLFPRDIYPTLPKSVMLSSNVKENKILRTMHAIEHAVPAFPRIHRGLLFATGCADPFVVPVPLDHGIPTYRTMDDLRAYTWISPRLVNFPRYPIFMRPFDTIGSTTIFHALGWREDLAGGRALLIFMTSIHEVGPTNHALCVEPLTPRSVHGDVLLMLEVNGIIVDTTLDEVPFARAAFAE